VHLVSIGHALDGGNCLAFRFGGKNEARTYKSAVQCYGASAAIAGATTLFGARKAKTIAKPFQEALMRIAKKFGGFAINGGGDVQLCHCF
jgi:hypothetical protein